MYVQRLWFYEINTSQILEAVQVTYAELFYEAYLWYYFANLWLFRIIWNDCIKTFRYLLFAKNKQSHTLCFTCHSFFWFDLRFASNQFSLDGKSISVQRERQQRDIIPTSKNCFSFKSEKIEKNMIVSNTLKFKEAKKCKVQ